MRRYGLRLSELTPVGKGLVNSLVRTGAQIELAYAWIDAQGGVLDENGKPRPAASFWLALEKTHVSTLAQLDKHIREQVQTPEAVLDEYLDAEYVEEPPGPPADSA